VIEQCDLDLFWKIVHACPEKSFSIEETHDILNIIAEDRANSIFKTNLLYVAKLQTKLDKALDNQVK
jgi:hypothetical protein